jgi:site-specific recombinase
MDFREVILSAKDPLVLFTRLVDAIRPSRGDDHRFPLERLEELTSLLGSDAYCRETVLAGLIAISTTSSYHDLLTQSGLSSRGGFIADLVRKVKHRLLPPVPDTGTLGYVIGRVFRMDTDYKWVLAIPDRFWMAFVASLRPEIPEGAEVGISPQYTDAMLVISSRIAFLGMDPLITSRVPGTGSTGSPFYRQQKILMKLTGNWLIHPPAGNGLSQEGLLLESLLTECEQLLEYVHSHRNEIGASMELTYLTLHLRQHIRRLRSLLRIVECTPSERYLTAVALFKEFVRNENTRYSISKHVSENSGLLAFQVTEHAAKTGEHYISSTRKDYLRFFGYALGGGFVVAFLVILKAWTYQFHLPPLIQTILFGLIYGIGFLVIHFSGFTLATKQPAMTASTLAGALEGEKGIDNLAVMIVKISRTQFISFAGNLLMVFPVVLGLSWLVAATTGYRFASETDAMLLFDSMHPWYSASMWYAAIAGLLLFTAGLISGYFDNKVVFNRIPDRIRSHPALQWLPARKREKIAAYTNENLGAMAGNFLLGFLLAFAGFFGYILGLPLDIRHVTFAMGSFGLVAETLGPDFKGDYIWVMLLSVFLIGTINFLVSFSLAIFTAIRSRNVQFRQSRALIELLRAYLFTYPFDFIFPPSKERVIERKQPGAERPPEQ